MTRNHDFPSRVPLFLSGHAANAFNIGVQMVLVAWLAAGVLRLPATGIAWVQAAVLAPNLLLILLAGVLVDRHHPARILQFTNIALLIVHSTVLLLLGMEQFGAETLLLYAFCLGCGNSFVQAAREKLVAQLDDRHLQKNISLAGICQYLAQAMGILAASLMDVLGVQVLVCIQATLCVVATICYGFLARHVSPGAAAIDSLAPAVGAALKLVWRTMAVRHLILLVAFNGFMHLGMFLVLLPVLARDHMGFTSLEYGLLQLCFTLGSVLSFWVIWRRAKVRFPRQAVLFCLLYTGLIGLALAGGPTRYGLFGLIFLWGCVAGASANLSRLVLQSTISDGFRGRAMAVYQFALFGMAPLGALFAGFLVQEMGARFTFHLLTGSSFTLFFVSLFSRALWAVKQDQH